MGFLFKWLLLAVPIMILGITVSAQVQQAMVGIDGLTCSQCSRSVEMQLRKLPFVAGVDMSLDSAVSVVTFKKNLSIVPERLASAVTNAGFAVRYIRLWINLDSVSINTDNSFTIKRIQYRLLSGTGQRTGVHVFNCMGKIYGHPVADGVTDRHNVVMLEELK